MAAKPVMQVEGAKELRKALKHAEGDLADFKQTHVEVAQIVIAYSDSSGLTPVRTGAMRATQRAQNTGAAAGIRVGNRAVFYAPFVYYGTRTIKANPWLHEAAEQSQEQWQPVYERAVEDIVAKSVRGLS